MEKLPCSTVEFPVFTILWKFFTGQMGELVTSVVRFIEVKELTTSDYLYL